MVSRDSRPLALEKNAARLAGARCCASLRGEPLGRGGAALCHALGVRRIRKGVQRFRELSRRSRVGTVHVLAHGIQLVPDKR